MRIVADTNLLIASIFWSGAPYRIVQAALDGQIEIVTSQTILKEVRKVLKAEFELREPEIDDIVNGILLYATLVNPMVNINAVRDPKDNHIIESAVTAQAECIVTRDKDLLVLKHYAGIKIVTPEQFLALIKQQ